MQQIDQRYQPVVGKVREMTQASIEQNLSKIDPEWKNYEANMAAVMQKHPTLVNDPETLYRMAVPQEVFEAKATQAALAKLKSQADGSRVSGSTNKKQPAGDGPPKGATFAETAEWAKAKLARDGITPP